MGISVVSIESLPLTLCDKVEEEEQAFSACRGWVWRGEVCLLSSMCRKLEAKREDGGGGGGACSCHSGCVAQE